MNQVVIRLVRQRYPPLRTEDKSQEGVWEITWNEALPGLPYLSGIVLNSY
jgi:hypothetical protein